MSNNIVAEPVRRLSLVSPKITEELLQLGAVLYIRQSTSQQLREHQESTARQYALKDRLLSFGWPEEQVIVIDDDLGISGSGKAERPGFRRLLKLVTDGKVGIVLGLEMSRLAIPSAVVPERLPIRLLTLLTPFLPQVAQRPLAGFCAFQSSTSIPGEVPGARKIKAWCRYLKSANVHLRVSANMFRRLVSPFFPGDICLSSTDNVAFSAKSLRGNGFEQ